MALIRNSDSNLYVDEALVKLLDIDGKTLELGTSSNSYFYDITDTTIFYEVNSDGEAETSLADDNDLEEGQRLLAICDDDANLMYVVIFDDYTVITGRANVDVDDDTIDFDDLDGAEITLTLDGAEFDSSISKSNFSLNSAPTGLSIDKVERTDDDEAVVTLEYTGVTLTVDDTFTITIDSSDLNVSYDLETDDITIDVDEIEPALSYSATTFDEASANDGTIDTIVTATLEDDTFVVSSGTMTDGTHYSVTDGSVPSGLTLVVTATNDTTVTIALTGTADSHINTDDTTFTLTFKNAAFTASSASDVDNYSQVFSINFSD